MHVWIYVQPCDEQKAKELNVKKSLENATAEDRTTLEKELKQLQTQMQFHTLKDDWFYKRKQEAKRTTRKTKNAERFAVDCGWNLLFIDASTSEVSTSNTNGFICSMSIY